MKIVLGVPVYDSVQFDACASLVALVQEWPRLRPDDELVPLFVRGQPASFVRNTIANEALRVGADAIIWNDSDISLDESSQYARLVETLFEVYPEYHGVGLIVGAPCIMQAQAGRFTTNISTRPDVRATTAEPFAINAVGFGLVAMHTSALLTVPRPWFEFKSDPKTGKPLVGEDIGFCDALVAAGGGVLCEPRVFPKHHFRRPFWALNPADLSALLTE